MENKEDASKFTDFVVDESATSSSSSAAAPSTPSTPKETPVVTPISTPTTESSSRIIASPLAKNIAKEKQVDLSLVKGSGPNGRIVKVDVLDFKPVSKVVSPSTPPPLPVSTSAYTDIPLSNVRKVIASRLSESKTSIPHFYLTIQLNADKILKLREILNKESNGSFKLSVNDFVIKASSLALRDVPAVNSSWQGSFIRQ